nr:AfsA-related hotdog domain-containing protein [Gilliamella apicola]
MQSAATVYSYFLFNDTENQYFYKKNHEHVPGMMLIEAARQAVYDYVYSISGHVFKEVSISMTSLEVNFLGYTVSSYPVELLFSHKDHVRRYKPKTIEKKAWFYQRGKLTGTFCLVGGIIPMSIFSRLRNENYAKAHDFYPFNKDISLKVLSDSGKELCKKIVSLSLTGVTIEDDENDITNISSVILQDKYEFSIKQYEVKEANNNWHHLIFDDLSKSQLLTLNNMINTSFFQRPMFEALDI